MATAAGGGGSHHNAIQNDHQNKPDEDTIKRRLKLHEAAAKGDWKTAERIFRNHKEDKIAKLTERNETALHVATLAEKIEFVRELVDMSMDEEGRKALLASEDIEGRTALFLAALTGKVELARVIIDGNPDLAEKRTREGILPIHTAAFSGHRKMVEFLWIDHGFLNEKDLRDLLVGLINSDMFDIALDIIPLGDGEDLLIEKDTYGESALSVIARKPQMLSKSGFFAYLWSLLFPDSKAVTKKACQLLRRVWEKLEIMKEAQITEVIRDGWRTIFVAVENGNVEFVRILIQCYPDLVIKTNEEGHSIFHVAILHRQHEIFELIYTIGSMKKMIAAIIDIKGNNMLHLAAQLAPSHRLQPISGEALQLQLELLWFQEVETLVGSRLAKERNMFSEKPQTPRDLFIQNHKDMICRGKDHVKKTADSCILVAILVAAVVFAAAYTVAGGPDQRTGYPMFLHDISFKIFAVADAVSLISSVASVLSFLSLLTSSNALDEFAWWIPFKLLVGFLTLFVSLVSMMVAFDTAFFIYFKQHHVYLKYGLPVAVVSSVPPLLFLCFPGQVFHMIRFTFLASSSSGSSLCGLLTVFKRWWARFKVGKFYHRSNRRSDCNFENIA